MRAWPTGGLWRHPDFLKLWSAETISQFGSQVGQLALPLVAVIVLESTPFEVAALGRETMWIGAVLGSLAFLPVLISPMRTLREMPEPTSPEPAVELA